MSDQSLMLAIVQLEDADAATHALTQAGLRVTRISSIGGFLQQGSVTLLLGLGHGQVMGAIELMEANCRTRTAYINVAPQATDTQPGYTSAGYVMPLEVMVGGATIFVLPVRRLIHVGAQPLAATSEAQERGKEDMKLIMAIVPERLSREILDTLMQAQYRATLISTTGGFLRKGNATLLIGVEAERVDDVLQHITDVCTATSKRGDSGESYATIFVLDVEQYKHV